MKGGGAGGERNIFIINSLLSLLSASSDLLSSAYVERHLSEKGKTVVTNVRARKSPPFVGISSLPSSNTRKHCSFMATGVGGAGLILDVCLLLCQQRSNVTL